jgi:hypothetical protein
MQEARTKAKKILVDVTIPVGIPIMIRSWRGNGAFWGMMRGWQPGASSAGVGSSLWESKTASAPTPPTSKEGTIADIKAGSTISIWLTENTGERKVGSWVSVSPSQGSMPSSGGR